MTNNYDPHNDGFIYDEEVIEIPDDIFDDNQITPSPAAGNNGDFMPVFDDSDDIFGTGNIDPFADIPLASSFSPTFSVMVDNVPYRQKPNDRTDVPCIKSRLANECKSPITSTGSELLHRYICNGHTICPAVIQPTPSKTTGKISHNSTGFISQQIFLVDIDNAHKKEKDPATGKYRKLTIAEGYITPAQAIEICRNNGIEPLFVYKTFSYKPDYEKFRIAFLLSDPVTDNTERLHIIQTLIGLFGATSDTNCTNADRVMHGGKLDCIILDNTDKTVNKQVIINIWQKANDHLPLPTLPPLQQNTPAPPSLPHAPSTIKPKLDGYNPSDYDADPNILLGMINPNDCNYQVWTSICAAYKASGGSLQIWMQWCSGYAKDNPAQDRTTYNHLTGENSSINTLKYYAGQLAPAQYTQYIDNLNNQQHQAIADARQRKQQQRQTSQLPVAPAGNNTIAPSLSSSNTQKKPQAKLATEFGEFRPEFVWKPYIPKHEYTVLLAESGIGKTMFCCGVAAAISRGDSLPGEEYPHPAGKVLFISSEDSGACIRDRVIKSNANLENIAICDCSDSIGLSFVGEGMQNLRRIIQENNPELVIIDPWQAFVGETVDLNRMNQTRPILQSVAQLAKDTDCGIILISHVNKRAQGENANFAAAGSTELVNAARSAIKIEYDNNPEFPDDKDNRLAIHTKSNFSGLGRTVAYSTTGGFVTWTGFSDIDRNTIELAARMRKSVYDALKIQRADKADFTDLMRAIADLRAKSTDKIAKILYDELELYSNQGEAIWNGKNANQKSKILTSLIPTLKADYHLLVNVEPYPFQKACYDNQIRKGRGISVQIIPPNPNDNT